jgi:uncharacterized delta-60 repeat protein
MTQGIGAGRRGRHVHRPRGCVLQGSRGWGLGLVAALLLGLSWAGVGAGAPGDLDPTFGAGGVAIAFGPQDSAHALALQPDGTLVVAGTSSRDGDNHILLARFRPDGRPDPAFGSGGKVTVAAPSRGNALLRQPDGTLVVAGSGAPAPGTPREVFLARFLPDGGLDPSFGTAGTVTTRFVANNAEEATALLRQPDGRLVVAGRSDVLGGHFSSAILARYLPDGRLDPTFGVEGKVTVQFEGGTGLSALVRQPDGTLVAAGFTGQSRVTLAFLVLARFHPDGRLDASFGQGGWVALREAGPASALVRQPDGTLVVVASRSVDDSNYLLLARYLPDGQLDPAFGRRGVVLTDVGVPAFPLALLRQPDGTLVVGGYLSAGGATDLLLARYLPDGHLDPAFGAGGLVRTDAGGGELPRALRPQPDGKLVVGGWFSTGGASDVLLARYQALGCPAVDPEPCLAALAAFVTEVYQAALARLPDAGEAGYWADVLATEPSPDTVRGLLHVVFDGPEFRQRPVNPWQYIDALYRAVLGRTPGQAELDWWVQAVLDRFNTLLPAFLESPEFQRLVPSCQDQAAVTLLVGRLYQHVLGRVASPEELAWWTADIGTWCAVEEAVAAFFTTGEYLGVPRTLADHVTVLYRALLAREPDARGLAWGVESLAGQLAALEDDLMAGPEFEARVYRLFP